MFKIGKDAEPPDVKLGGQALSSQGAFFLIFPLTIPIHQSYNVVVMDGDGYS